MRRVGRVAPAHWHFLPADALKVGAKMTPFRKEHRLNHFTLLSIAALVDVYAWFANE
jgi:hypothetical protein